jgi:nitrite reductase/ring-hydroxylating ferredoxin subunit
MSRHVIGPEYELREERRRIVLLDGRSIGLFYSHGDWFAIRNRCPHHGAELCRGTVSGTLVMKPERTLAYVMDGMVLRCPWHGFEFDLATGRSLALPERLRVRTYPVTVEDGQVVVTL